jgi:aryl-alcohol dehydrogenase-like predicted oxidoreductase
MTDRAQSSSVWTSWPVIAALWAVSLLLSWKFIGDHVARWFIGLDPSGLSRRGVIGVGIVILATAALTFVRLRRTLLERRARRAAARRIDADATGGLDRRQLLVNGVSAGAVVLGAAATGGVGVVTAYRRWQGPIDEIFRAEVERTAPTQLDAWKTSHVRAYRRLGRTNAMVSDISLGTGAISGSDGEQIARAAIDRGVTYFDTAPDYSGAGSEQAMGRAMRGVRDKMFVATKFCTPQGHLPAGSPVAAYIRAVEGSLERLQTDHVDLVHIHSCDELDRLMDANAHEAFDRLKEQGKVRFLGVSTHTPNLPTVARTAIASGRFDVMMLAYHHGIWGDLDAIVADAAKHDVGIVAMKTLKGARHENLVDFRGDAGSYAQAAFRWVLSNPNVGCLVVSFSKPEHVDEYLYASGGKLSREDVAVLGRYDARIAGTYCQPHCGECLDACPEQLAVNDVLRYRMYFEDYGREKEGMRLYAALERNAARCAGCSAPCEAECPVGVRIHERMLGAHALLRFPDTAPYRRT